MFEKEIENFLSSDEITYCMNCYDKGLKFEVTKEKDGCNVSAFSLSTKDIVEDRFLLGIPTAQEICFMLEFFGCYGKSTNLSDIVDEVKDTGKELNFILRKALLAISPRSGKYLCTIKDKPFNHYTLCSCVSDVSALEEELSKLFKEMPV